MVNLQIDGDRVTVKVLGLHKVWAFRNSLAFRVSNVTDVRFDPGITVGLYRGLRMPGTHIPGVVVAGTYYREKRKEFWDVGKIENSIVIDLADENFDRVVIETADPLETIALLTEALDRRGRHESSEG